MNPKQLVILAVVAAVAGGIYFVANSKREGTVKKKGGEVTVKVGDRAVEDFDVAAATKLRIQQKNREVNLVKDGDSWVVTERDNYAADGKKITGLLHTIRGMEVADSRSARGNAALKSLQLLEPDESGEGGSGAGTKVEIGVDGGSRSVVFGSNYTGAGRGGRFIRTSSGAVYVVSTILRNLETDPAAWLDKEFFTVKDAERISVEHENAEDSFTVFRDSEGAALALEDPAEGEELNTSKSSRLSNLFSSIGFTDYVSGDAATPANTGLDKPVTATIETFDGFTYVVKVGKRNDAGKYHLGYEVSAEIPEPPAPEPDEETPAATGDDEELSDEEKKKREEEAAEKAAEKQAREDRRKEIEALNEKLATEKKFAGKVYLVDSWTVEGILKKRGEIIKTEEDKKKEAEEAAKEAAGGTATPGGAPSIIETGPNGEQRITATTPPVSLDPEAMKLAEEERKKQEQAVIEKAKKDQDAAAIRRMIEEHERENAAEGATPGGDTSDGEGEGEDDPELGPDGAAVGAEESGETLTEGAVSEGPGGSE